MSGDTIATLCLFVLLALLASLVTYCAVLPSLLRARERAKLYELLTNAQERGQALPDSLVQSLTTTPELRPDRDHRRGIVLLAVAAGLVLMALCVYGMTLPYSPRDALPSAIAVAGLACIPAAVGVAFLLLNATGKKTKA